MIRARYEFRDDADGLLTRLILAYAEDKTAERKFKWSIGLLVALVLPAIFGAVWLQDLAPRLSLSVLLTPLAFVGSALYYKGRDIDDHKLHAATRLVRILRADLVGASPVGLSIDFREYRKGGQLQGKTGGWFGPKVYKYRHSWLGLRGKLADGRIVRLAVTDDVTRKEKPKRKYTKVRERLMSEVAIGIRVGKTGAAEAATRLRLYKPPAPFVSATASSEGEWLTARLVTAPSSKLEGRGGYSQGSLAPLGGDAVLESMLWAYKGITAPASGG